MSVTDSDPNKPPDSLTDAKSNASEVSMDTTVEEPVTKPPIYSEEELQQQYYAQLQGLQQNYDGQRSQLERQYEELKLKCKDDEQELNRIIAYEQQQYQLLQQQIQQIQQQIYQHFQLLHQENQKRKEEQQNEPEHTDSDMKDDTQETVPEATGDTGDYSPDDNEPKSRVDVEENEEQPPLVPEEGRQASKEISISENIISAEPGSGADVPDLGTSECFPTEVPSPVNIQKPGGDVAKITELSNVSQAQDSLGMPIASDVIKEGEFSVLPVSPDRSPISQNKDTVHPTGQSLGNVETLSASLPANQILAVNLSPKPSLNTIENVPQNLPVNVTMNTSVKSPAKIPPDGLPNNLLGNMLITSEDIPVTEPINLSLIPSVTSVKLTSPKHLPINTEGPPENSRQNPPGIIPTSSLVDVPIISSDELQENVVKCESQAEEILDDIPASTKENTPSMKPERLVWYGMVDQVADTNATSSGLWSSRLQQKVEDIVPIESGREIQKKNDQIQSAPTMTQNQFVALLEQDEELRHDLDDMMATSHPSTDLLTHFFSHVQRDGFIDINTLA